MTTAAAYLEDRGVLRISGEDSATFLQGLLTNDVEKLSPSEARYAALLTPQGKILFDMFVVRLAGDPPAFLIDCAAAQAAELAKRLGFYKLRSKVTIADESAEMGVVAESGKAPVENKGVIFADPRDERLGWRMVLPRDEAVAIGSAHAREYEALRIAVAAPKGAVDFAYGDAFPQDANLDLLHGVDFGKGCYVGQEVVSRMKHRGTARKRVVRLKLSGDAPPPGTPVVDGELPVGSLGSASGREALAMLRLDRVEDAASNSRTLTAGHIEVEIAG